MQNAQLGEQSDSVFGGAGELPFAAVHGGIFDDELPAVVLYDTVIKGAVVKPRFVQHKGFVSYGPVSMYVHHLSIPPR